MESFWISTMDLRFFMKSISNAKKSNLPWQQLLVRPLFKFAKGCISLRLPLLAYFSIIKKELVLYSSVQLKPKTSEYDPSVTKMQLSDNTKGFFCFLFTRQHRWGSLLKMILEYIPQQLSTRQDQRKEQPPTNISLPTSCLKGNEHFREFNDF